MTDEKMIVAKMFTGCPLFFCDLQSALTGTKQGQDLAIGRGFKVKRTYPDGHYYVQDLDKLAAKWKLAKSFRNLACEDISPSLADGYSHQVRVDLAVRAFERFAKLTGKSWSEVYEIVLLRNTRLCEQVRNEFEQDTYDALKLEAHPKLKERIAEFEEGDDTQLYPVAVAIRHAFAHGSLHGNSKIDGVAEGIRDYILDGIANHCMGLIGRAKRED